MAGLGRWPLAPKLNRTLKYKTGGITTYCHLKLTPNLQQELHGTRIAPIVPGIGNPLL